MIGAGAHDLLENANVRVELRQLLHVRFELQRFLVVPVPHARVHQLWDLQQLHCSVRAHGIPETYLVRVEECNRTALGTDTRTITSTIMKHSIVNHCDLMQIIPKSKKRRQSSRKYGPRGSACGTAE